MRSCQLTTGSRLLNIYTLSHTFLIQWSCFQPTALIFLVLPIQFFSSAPQHRSSIGMLIQSHRSVSSLKYTSRLEGVIVRVQKHTHIHFAFLFQYLFWNTRMLIHVNHTALILGAGIWAKYSTSACNNKIQNTLATTMTWQLSVYVYTCYFIKHVCTLHCTKPTNIDRTTLRCGIYIHL